MIDWERISGFDWDGGNVRKNADKHDVSQIEAEQAFFNEPLLMVPDMRHSAAEQRIHALGRTDGGRLLHVTFTLRSNGAKIRVISARDMSRRNGAIMTRMTKPVPQFSTEAEERTYWEAHDSADHIDWTKAERMRLPNLKPSSTSISLRLPNALLERIKVAAGKRDVPYQSLIKIWLAEKIDAANAKR